MISVGDMVMVVRPTPCCGNCHGIGAIFRVVEVVEVSDYQCNFCGVTTLNVAAVDEQNDLCRISRLKRIPPLCDLETEKITEEANV